jgi:hypothetical protein
MGQVALTASEYRDMPGQRGHLKRALRETAGALDCLGRHDPHKGISMKL